RRAYFLAGLALACPLATRLGLLFNSALLAYYLLRRDPDRPPRWRGAAVAAGLLPILAALGLLGWYNLVRFGSPTEMGLAWHDMAPAFRADFARYGAFNLHYLPKNLYYQFISYTLLTSDGAQNGGGLFWMTPVLLGAPYAAWRGRRDPLVWALLGSCALVYLPVGLVMGTGYVTFGPRYLLDLMVPIVVLAARGIRRWPVGTLLLLMLVGWATYAFGSLLWWRWDGLL
ncbi:MAG: hypothetical protein ACR2J6_03400, partial [Thermoleophilaceae bacterium]